MVWCTVGERVRKEAEERVGRGDRGEGPGLKVREGQGELNY